MPESKTFDEVLAGLASNSPSAAEAVVRHNYAGIIAIMRGRIGSSYQAKLDAESIANSAMKSFFIRYTGDGVPDTLEDWQDLWNLLAAIAMNKLKSRYRKLHQKKRNVTKEVGEDGLADLLLTDAPDAELLVREAFDVATAGYTDTERQILHACLDGYLVAEVAAQSKLSARTVIRIRDGFRQRLEALRAKDGADLQ